MSVIENVFFKQGEFTLEIPRMEVLDRGITALKGPSGSGKSTLIRLLLGLEPVQSFRWMFQGVDMAALPVEKRNFGVVFQSLELFPHMTAAQNVQFPLKCRGITGKEALMKIRPLMERLEIWECAERKPGKLSGGERQRVALARALSFHPRYVFLDEPFSSLDEEIRTTSRTLVKEVLKDLEIPALLVSHDRADIEALSGLTHVIEKGRLRS